MKKPETARQIIQSFSWRFKSDAVELYETIVHFNISGSNGGEFTVEIKEDQCIVREGIAGNPNCTITAKDKDYEDVESGRTNSLVAIATQKIKVSSLPEAIKFSSMFRGINSSAFEYD